MRTVNPPASRVRRFESDPYHHSSYKDCSQCNAAGYAARLTEDQWIATGYALAMTTLYFASMRVCGRAEVLHASVIARNNVTRQSIVSRGGAYGLCGSLTEDQWIATGYALAMTTLYFASMRVCRRTEVLHASVIARNNVTRQSIVSRGVRTGYAARLTEDQWIATGYALAMTRVAWKGSR
jgi:uncharacterized protein (UPF0212 family)